MREVPLIPFPGGSFIQGQVKQLEYGVMLAALLEMWDGLTGYEIEIFSAWRKYRHFNYLRVIKKVMIVCVFTHGRRRTCPTV